MGSSQRLPRILLLKHDEKTTVGTALDWASSRLINFDVAVAESFVPAESPQYDGVIVFGGDMEVWETEKYSWLVREKLFIGSMIDTGRAVFGICLGSQLLAEQLGAKILPMDAWQFGWREVSLSNLKKITPFHCHHSKFMRPRNSRLVATDKVNFNQGFKVGSLLVGYQFHCEIDRTRIDHILENCGEMHGFVQTEEQVRTQFEIYETPLREWFFRELDAWLDAMKFAFALPEDTDEFFQPARLRPEDSTLR